ncbi:MAG: hypothetical protein U0746_01605 [Gemmataceae bacterium]
MSFRRAFVVLTVGLGVVLPVAGPCTADLWNYGSFLNRPGSWRWSSLAANSLCLVAGTCVLALPVGTLLALLLERTDLIGRKWIQRGLIVALFVPLPVIATAWQEVVGGGGWSIGLPAAICLHAIAGLPWVVWLVALGAASIEPEVEDDALTHASAWVVLQRVVLSRIWASVGVAGLWLAISCATEITITDVTQVRTFAEEVYTQTVLPDPGAPVETMPARAVAVAFPPVVLTTLFVGFVVVRWRSRLPALTSTPRQRPIVLLGRWQAPMFALALLTLIALLAVPIGVLVQRLGMSRHGAWSASDAAKYLFRAAIAHGPTIGRTVGAAVCVGGIATALAVISCSIVRRGWWAGVALVVITAALWSAPGPVIGVALKQAIDSLLDFEGRFGINVLSPILYSGPSPIPAAWACLIRFFPCAVALVWPAVRVIPVGQFDSAELDGAGEVRHVVWPHAVNAALRAGAAVAILTLGEIGASKIVATPAGEFFAHDVFARMHYGPGNQLAALCLLMLAVVIPPAVLLSISRAR